ncbi:MAG: hypothetical protein ISS15_18935 [Alphaproteobacteria bacterium]|nr:hypothetical protein [Alphaproteobacteria bacterium]MBL6940294.1 hypothetical protein [Alphaproteobacteria bacterium]MBL7099737.1 hypothetical protein [Alphaproteobacteria bacterium]
MTEHKKLHGTRTHEVAHVTLALPANVRAILRVGNEFFLRTLDSMASLADDDLIKALVYTAMWTANVKHITDSVAANQKFAAFDTVVPDEMRQPVSVMAISNALRIPYETVRRYVHTLLKEGRCQRVGPKGLIVPAAVIGGDAHRAAMRANYHSLLRFVTELRRAGFDFTPYRHRLPQTVPLPPEGQPMANSRAVTRVLGEMVMHGVDLLGRLHDSDFLYALIFTTVWTNNVHHITVSNDNLKYGALTELPPDDARRPVTVHAVATSLRVPYETVRRYANKMVKNGSAVRVGNKGLIVPRERLAVESSLEGTRNAYIYIERTVAALYRAGFDFGGY